MRYFYSLAVVGFALLLPGCGDDQKPKMETAPVVKEKVEAVTTVAQSAPIAVSKAGLSPELNGKKFFKKCIACHRANGDGIPGSFPKLNSGLDILAGSEAGRAYIVLVVYNGLRGNLMTQDGAFNGIMVRQAGGKSPADVADLLNYILKSFYETADVRPFTAEEVKGITEKVGRLSADKVLTFRPKAH